MDQDSGGKGLEHQITAAHLLRVAGGVAYLRGLYSAVEGLGGRQKVHGNIVLGRVLWDDDYRVRLQVVPPFENRCSCSKGGNCRHVVTLGLTFLYRERRKAGGVEAPPEEIGYYLISMLKHDDLRGLAMQLLAAVPEATPVALQFLDRPGHWIERDEYALKWEDE